MVLARDHPTHWMFLRIYDNQSEASSVDSWNRLENTVPMKIGNLRIDNGSQFTDRFTSNKREPTGGTSSIYAVRLLAPSTACAHPTTRKPTAWWSASTAASAKCSTRRDSLQGPNWNPRSQVIRKRTISKFLSVHSTT